MDEKDIKQIEEVLGYTFTNKKLLVQAFTRSSFSSDNEILDSEVLEFIGDRVIEFQITKILVNITMTSNNQGLNSKYTEGELTTLKSLIVENTNFASVIDDFGFDRFMRIGKNESIQESYKSDLLESIVGAIAVDSFFDEQKLYELVDYLLSPREYIQHSGFDSFLYLKRWCKLKKVSDFQYTFNVIDNEGLKSYITKLKFGNYEVTETHDTKIDSLFRTAVLAHSEIRENGEEITVKDFLLDLNENNGKSKLNELKRLGYYNELNIFEEKTLDDRWKITFQMDRLSTWYIDSNKKKAMKICSLICLNSFISKSFRTDELIVNFILSISL